MIYSLCLTEFKTGYSLTLLNLSRGTIPIGQTRNKNIILGNIGIYNTHIIIILIQL